MDKCVQIVVEKKIKEILDDQKRSYLLRDPLRRRCNERLFLYRVCKGTSQNVGFMKFIFSLPEKRQKNRYKPRPLKCFWCCISTVIFDRIPIYFHQLCEKPFSFVSSVVIQRCRYYGVRQASKIMF